MDKGVSTDELCGVSRLTASELRRALHDLERLRIATNDTAITAFIHVGVENASRKRLEAVGAAETSLIDALRELAPDLDVDERSTISLRLVSQELRNRGHAATRPDMVEGLLRGIARDGKDEDSGVGSISLRQTRTDRDHYWVRLQRSWDALSRTAELRRAGAAALLRHLEGRLEPGRRGTDLQVETTLGGLTDALESDLYVRAEAKEISKLLDRCLLWLHEQKVLTLGKGLTVFRPAMTIHLAPQPRRFTKADFEPLQLHYDEQVRQIHIMTEYAQRGLASIPEALRLVEDYFTLGEEAFLARWMPGKEGRLQRQTTPESWRAIVEDLGNPQQARIVADDREQANVLVLAGPGSGKTRVLVHRIAYLIRVRREDPRGILALAYNRHAAAEIRSRLFDLIGDDARGVTISTCHGLAMRLVGASFAARSDRVDGGAFDEILREAVALLRGDGLSPRGGGGAARDPHSGLPVDPRRRIPGYRARRIRADRCRGRPIGRGRRQPLEPVRGRR